MKSLPIKKNAEILEKYLYKAKGKFTLNDAAAITGIPTEEARESLNELMGKYLLHLEVSENGDIIYDFGSSPKRRGAKTFKEIWQEFLNVLWKGFKIFFKIWITITLVVYFVIFVVVLIALVVAMTAANSNKDSDRGKDQSSGVFRLIGEIFFAIFRWNTIMGGTYYQTDRYGYPYKKYTPTQTNWIKNQTDPGKKKNFIAAVYDFVFGPPRVEPDPLNNYKEIAAYARQNKGVVVLSEFKALAGWNHDQAQEFMTDCIARFNGSAEISNNSILYADFKDLTRSTTQASDGKVIWYWDEYEPDYELTGNTTGRNLGIIFMNGFNLVFSLYFLLNAHKVNILKSVDPNVIFWGLGVVPAVFSIIFFAVPILRYIRLIPKKRQRHLNNIKKRIVKVIYQNANKRALTPEEIIKQINVGKEEKLSKSDITSIMNRLIIDWGGEALPTDQGNIIYKFDTLHQELQEVSIIRANRKTSTELGNTYIDTKDIF